MKILYILPSLDSTAPIFVARDLANYFFDQGHEVKVYYFDDIVNVTISCECKNIGFNDIINFDDFDIIHSHMFRPDMYIYKNRKHINRAKTISTIHCDIRKDLRFSYGFLISDVFTPIWTRYLRCFDNTVCINTYLYNIYKSTINNCELIFNGINIEPDNEDYDCAEIIEKLNEYRNKGYIVIASYSSIIARKGLEQIIEVVRKNDKYAYVCIGDGDDKKRLEKKAKEYRLEDRISFYKKIDKPYRVLKSVDVFAIPSLSEGFSLALLEAGLMCKSIICSDIPSFTESFTEEEVTFFPINKIDVLEKKIEVAFLSRKEKGEAINRLINLKYSRTKMLNSYRELYLKLYGDIS